MSMINFSSYFYSLEIGEDENHSEDLNEALNEAQRLRNYDYFLIDDFYKEYSIKLTNELGKRYDVKTLRRYRQFYLLIEKGAPVARQLSWSHYQELIPVKDIYKINYYINITINNHHSNEDE